MGTGFGVPHRADLNPAGTLLPGRSGLSPPGPRQSNHDCGVAQFFILAGGAPRRHDVQLPPSRHAFHSRITTVKSAPGFVGPTMVMSRLSRAPGISSGNCAPSAESETVCPSAIESAQ